MGPDTQVERRITLTSSVTTTNDTAYENDKGTQKDGARILGHAQGLKIAETKVLSEEGSGTYLLKVTPLPSIVSMSGVSACPHSPKDSCRSPLRYLRLEMLVISL